MGLREVGLKGTDWIGLAQYMDMVAGPCEYGNESSGSIKFGEFLE